jgi:NitT/TauT family transport system substrate-binding protein
MKRVRVVSLVLAVVALAVSACGGSDSSVVGNSNTSEGAASGSGGSGSAATLRLGEVPAFSAAVLNLGVDKGMFAKHDINLEISATDAGPAVITSAIQGSYDVAIAAPFPIFIALSKGAPLKAVSQINAVRPNEGNSGALVRPDSGIKTFKDLEGKTVATNALTSLTTLATKIAIDKAGGDSKKTKFVALPFAQANQAVKRGQADASVVLEPFVHQGVEAGLKQIGDPIGDDIPRDSAYGMIFTSKATYAKKGDEIQRFVAALTEAEAYANEHPDEVVAAAVEHLKISQDLAKALPMPTFDPTINPDAMKQLADVMRRYGYVSTSIDVASFLPAS